MVDQNPPPPQWRRVQYAAVVAVTAAAFLVGRLSRPVHHRDRHRGASRVLAEGDAHGSSHPPAWCSSAHGWAPCTATRCLDDGGGGEGRNASASAERIGIRMLSMKRINGSFLSCVPAKTGSTEFTVLLTSVMPPSWEPGAHPPRRKGAVAVTMDEQDPAKNSGCGLPSVAVVRNPWDRVASAYANKLGACDPCNITSRGWGSATEAAVKECKQRHIYTGYGKCRDILKFMKRRQGTRSFAEFVRYLKDHADENGHTRRIESGCLQGLAKGKTFPYTKVLHLEDGLMTGMAEFFGAAGLHGWEAAAAEKAAGIRGSNCNVGCKAERDPDGVAEHMASTLARRRSMYLNTTVKGGLRSPHELVDIVAKVYATEIAAFGYSFEKYETSRGTYTSTHAR